MKTTWTLLKCKKEALKYKTSTQWKKAYKASYNAAIKFKWLKECTMHMTPLKGAWNTIEKCKKIAEQYSTKRKWRSSHNSSYHYAHRKGWIHLCSTHMTHATRENSMEKELLKIVQKQAATAISKRFTVKKQEFKAKFFELDIFIPELNKGIEFDGKYWHGEGLRRSWTNDANYYHFIKDSFFASIGIQVIHVKEQDWLNNKQAEINKVFQFIGQ